MHGGHGDHRRGRSSKSTDVDEPAPGENRADDAPLSRRLERAEHVGHCSRWWFDPVGPQLVEQSKQLAIPGELGLATETSPNVLDDDLVSRGASVEDRWQNEGDLCARDAGARDAGPGDPAARDPGARSAQRRAPCEKHLFKPDRKST